MVIPKKSVEITCLTHEQVLTNIKNMAKLMKLTEPKKIFSGKIKPTREDIEMLNLKNVKERAEEYELFECEDQFYFIVIYSPKVEIQYFEACDWFEHLLKPFVYKTHRPKVYICYAMIMDQTKYKTIPRKLLSCPYRLVGIDRIHTIIGSNDGLNSFITDYELLEEKEKSFNDRDFPLILDSDPVVKILNALPGELIRAKLLRNDKGHIFTTYEIRRVTNTKGSLGFFDKSGLDNVEINDE